MSTLTTDRRSFIKRAAMLSAMTAAATMFPGILFANEQQNGLPKGGNLDWKKAPCRFCGVGCGVMVGVEAGKAVAVKGDPKSPVNKGLCCVKGYHSVMAMYGKDRLTKPLVKKNGRYVETSMKEALDLIASKMKETIKDHGKDAVSIYGSGQCMLWETFSIFFY